MVIQKYSNDGKTFSRLVEVRQLWGHKYYVEVDTNKQSSTSRKILELKDPTNSLLTNVFGGTMHD